MNGTIPPIPSGAAQPKTSDLAIWSLVLGILGFVLLVVCIGPLFAIPGVLCGHIALSKINRSSGTLTGQGLAIAGLVMGYLGILLTLILLPAIAIPNFVKARQTAQINMCLNNLRQIDAAKQEWALENSKRSTDTPTQSELTHFLKNGQFPTCPAGGVYTINSIGEVPTCSIPKHKLP